MKDDKKNKKYRKIFTDGWFVGFICGILTVIIIRIDIKLFIAGLIGFSILSICILIFLIIFMIKQIREKSKK